MNLRMIFGLIQILIPSLWEQPYRSCMSLLSSVPSNLLFLSFLRFKPCVVIGDFDSTSWSMAQSPFTRQSSQRHKSYTDENFGINLIFTHAKRAHNLPLMWVPFRCDFDKIHQTETPAIITNNSQNNLSVFIVILGAEPSSYAGGAPSSMCWTQKCAIVWLETLSHLLPLRRLPAQSLRLEKHPKHALRNHPQQANFAAIQALLV